MKKKKALYEVDYEKIFSPQTLAKLKGQSRDSLQRMLGGKNLMQTVGITMDLLRKIAQVEAPYKDMLEQEAVEMVSKAYPVIDYANIQIDAKIVPFGSPETLPDRGAEDQSDVTPEELPAVKRRRIINGITHGAAIRGAFGFLLFRDTIDTFDDDLVNKYNELSKATYGVYDDDQAIKMFLSMVNQKQEISGGSNWVEAENGEIIIHARAINFDYLIHEIVKGLYEIVSLQGFGSDKEKNQKIVGKTDKLANEPNDMRYGKFIYDAINDLYADSGYDDPRVREFLLTEIYKLPDDEFFPFIENAINGSLTPSQQGWAKGVMKDISRDITKDDTGLADLD